MFQKKYYIVASVLGFVFILFSVVPDLLGIGEKGFGYIDKFFLRNGLIFIIAGLTLFFFPGAH